MNQKANILTQTFKTIISLGLVFLMVSCSDSDKDEKRFFSLFYSLNTFTDYNKTGVYLLDTRNLYQNVLYRFDFASEQWTVEGDCNGLMNKYSSPEITSAFSVSPDTIIAISNKGEVFSYNLMTKHLNLQNSQAHVFAFYEDISFYNPYVYNDFNKKIYYIKKKSKEINISDQCEIYSLEKNSSWEKKCTINGYLIFESAFFRDKENIQMITNCQSFDNYYLPKDSVFVLNVNVTTGKSSIDTSFETLSIVPDYVEKDLLSTNQEFYVCSESYSTNKTKTLLSRIAINDQKIFQTDTLRREFELNDQNLFQFGKIVYIGKARRTLYVFNHNYYLFICEFPYKYSPETKQWTALQPCPFNTLNKK